MKELEKNKRMSKKEKTRLFLKSLIEVLFDVFLTVFTIALCVGVLFLCRLAIKTHILILPIIIALIIFCWHVHKVYIDNVHYELIKSNPKEHEQQTSETKRQDMGFDKKLDFDKELTAEQYASEEYQIGYANGVCSVLGLVQRKRNLGCSLDDIIEEIFKRHNNIFNIEDLN